MSFWSNKKVTVTGGAGFLGRHVVSRLENLGAEVFVPRRRDYNFVSPDASFRCLAEHPADIMIHGAAYYGGLGINLEEPGRIFYENLVMGAHLMEAARLHRVEKFIAIGTACGYPGYLEGDLKEEELWSGPLHDTVVHYGLTKKIMSVQGVAYKKQYGFNSIHLIPTNMYGPYDCYNPKRSHVVAALVRRFVEACLGNASEVTCWGTGKAIREFLYVEDAAEGIIRAAERYDNTDMALNLGTGRDTAIKELTDRVCEGTGYKGKINWDHTKADGTARKVLDVTLMKSALDWAPPTALKEGLCKTIEWYQNNKEYADAQF